MSSHGTPVRYMISAAVHTPPQASGTPVSARSGGGGAEGEAQPRDAGEIHDLGRRPHPAAGKRHRPDRPLSRRAPEARWGVVGIHGLPATPGNKEGVERSEEDTS